ncbi:hypothetical protein ACIBH1_45635 [Nonomuraea sp. NPDC050663]|uniref:hypothetical protein n=1 Tax=Nonomuraea sp. NPDC050663 TaxID=3364370 RepID=UPI0037979DE3
MIDFIVSQVIGSLVADLDSVTVRRDRSRILVGDARVVWDLAALPDIPEEDEEPTGRLPGVETMVGDGTWMWHRELRPRLLEQTGRYDLASAWSEMYGDHLREVEYYARIDWSTWSRDGSRVGVLQYAPVAVNDAWLSRVHRTYPGLVLYGIDPCMPLAVRAGDDGQVVGFVDPNVLPPVEPGVLDAISSSILAPA